MGLCFQQFSGSTWWKEFKTIFINHNILKWFFVGWFAVCQQNELYLQPSSSHSALIHKLHSIVDGRHTIGHFTFLEIKTNHLKLLIVLLSFQYFAQYVPLESDVDMFERFGAIYHICFSPLQTQLIMYSYFNAFLDTAAIFLPHLECVLMKGAVDIAIHLKRCELR